MDNFQRLVETEIRNILENIGAAHPANPTTTPSNTPTPGNAPRFHNFPSPHPPPPPQNTISQEILQTKLRILENMLQTYNDNMFEYNRAIRAYIDLAQFVFSDTRPRVDIPQTNPEFRNFINPTFYQRAASAAAGAAAPPPPPTTQSRTFLSYLIYPPTESDRPPSTISGLSVQQIQDATNTFLCTPDLVGVTCPISLEEFQENEILCSIRHCGHNFKYNQLMSWFSRNVKCPVCRHDLRTLRPATGSTENILEEFSERLESIIPNNIQVEREMDLSGTLTFSLFLPHNSMGGSDTP